MTPLATADRAIRVAPERNLSNSVDSQMGPLPITSVKPVVLGPSQIRVWFAKIVTGVLEGVKRANRVQLHKTRVNLNTECMIV